MHLLYSHSHKQEPVRVKFSSLHFSDTALQFEYKLFNSCWIHKIKRQRMADTDIGKSSYEITGNTF